MLITRRKIIPESRFESSHGIDEELLDSMQAGLVQGLSMGIARQNYTPLFLNYGSAILVVEFNSFYHMLKD